MHRSVSALLDATPFIGELPSPTTEEASKMSPRRIAYLLKMYPRFSETFIVSEIRELERQGLPLHIYSLKKPDDGKFHAEVSRVQARVTYLPESPLLAPGAYRDAHRQVFRWDPVRYTRLLGAVLKRRRRSALKHFLYAGYLAPRMRAQQIGHIHAHFASVSTSVALHLHRLTGISYSFTAHAKDIYTDSVKHSDLRRKIESARFVVTVSDYNREYLSSLSQAGRVLRIYNGLDLAQFCPNGTVRQDPPLVLAVGRLVEKKGFDDLIRACDLLRDHGCRFKCRIVGKGPLEGRLQSLIRGLRLEECVALTGPMPREALLDWYPRAAVLVAPCIVGSDGNRDGLPTVLIEAMALGTPVVSTDVTGIPELVQDGRTGLLVPQRNPVALADAIQRILTDDRRARDLAQAGRERVERDFDLAANVAQLRALLEGQIAP